MELPQQPLDRQALYFERFDARISRKILALIDADLIEEHRRRPLGQHSDRLERVLNYFRRGSLAGKVGILRLSYSPEQYQLVRFAGARGQPSEVLAGPLLTSLDEAYHAAFLLRVADLAAKVSGN